MKKFLALLLALVMVLSFAACGQTETKEPEQGEEETPVEEEVVLTWAEENADRIAELKATYPADATAAEADFAPDVRAAIDALCEAYGNKGNYAVFDFDNTCSIFDVEEQLAIYQLQTMTFAIEPEKLADVLFTEIGDHNEDRTDLGYGNGSYADWVEDITKAYNYLWETYGPFTAAGLDEAGQAEIQADPQWAEFATKMRTMYDLVYDAESASVAYPWVLYWFTGMTEEEVYKLACGSHGLYKTLETSSVTWTSPAEIESKVGVVEYTWTSGTQVSDSVIGLWKQLDEAGIDVWVCSASATDPIRAAIDTWGMHEYCTGMLAMTNVLDENGKYVNAYDYETGCGWYAKENGAWEKMPVELAEKAQTQGVGKVTAVANAIAPQYENHGPVAGFMDSTGDYNFCTEFETLKLVICFNRASRKVTDGGGVISELALYQRDVLGYDFAKADAAGDTLYVLQGREENGLRSLRNHTATMLLGKEEEQILKNDDNWAQLLWIIDNNMTVEDAINTFAMKTAAEDSALGFKYGFLKEYDGYHKHA